MLALFWELLHRRCLAPLDDLAAAVLREFPAGLHVSGYGRPGALSLDGDEGGEDLVPVDRLIVALRGRLPDFFYLASL